MYIPELSLNVMGSFMLTPRSLSERGLIRVERDICALVVHPPLEQAILVVYRRNALVLLKLLWWVGRDVLSFLSKRG